MGYDADKYMVQMYVDSTERTALPRGTILPYAGKIADIPTGWYVCDGDNGTPKLFGRVLQSYDESHNVGDFVDAGLPNITGSLYFSSRHNLGASGAFRNSYSGTSGYWNSSDGITYVYSTFDASRSNLIYGNSTTVQPPAYIVCYIIKMS